MLVHCSDGWDRTTQIVSLCMLIADPYYRTFEGFVKMIISLIVLICNSFETLIQRQWVEFGHKFADRSGILNGDDNEKSPVFLQFLDCVYQLWEKNFDQFEFNRRYLVFGWILYDCQDILFCFYQTDEISPAHIFGSFWHFYLQLHQRIGGCRLRSQ